MIVRFLVILTEYIGIMLCLYKAANKKIVIDKYYIMFFVINCISVILADKYREEHRWLSLFVYINFLVYSRMKLCEGWMNTIKVFGIMLITMPSLQLLVYYSTKSIFANYTSRHEYGIIVNCIVLILIILWKEKYFYFFSQKILKFSGLIIVMISVSFFAYLLYRYNYFQIMIPQLMIQSVVSIIGLGAALILWANTEKEKKSKAKEVQLYELYNKTFEEAITTIRIRQHEFDNHINAIKCMQLTIDNQDELVKAQTEYCDRILNENSFNKLLKLHTEPILVGFIYSKFMNAKEKGINIIHEVHAIEIHDYIEVSEIVEIIGILMDNAIEALMDMQNNDRVLIVKIIQEDKEKISIEIANRSPKYLNTEIEKFCIYGYSTKGDNRGIGLTRVKELTKKYKAEFLIENIIYNNENYLSFKIVFG